MKVPSTGMPFDVHQTIKASQYGHPNVYANSEHITPPIEKDRIRVVEAASRTEVKLKQWKEIEERAKEINMLRKQSDIRYDKDIPAYTQGEFVDIKV